MSNKNYIDWTKKELVTEIASLKKRKKFGLVWEEKREDVVERCKEETPVLAEVKNLEIISSKKDPTNLIIEGDNYHSLSVLNYTYKGKIDGIYIDPPYNTGNKDWKYNNSYVDLEDPYRHTKWISFMNKRLLLAKDLLKREGIICVTIDDHELPRLLMLMEDIFGEQNRLGVVCIRNNPSGRSTLKGISINHEYAIFYAKSADSQVGRMPRSKKQFDRYKKKDSEGYFEEVNFRKGGGIRKESPKSFYPLFISNSSWRIPKMKWNNASREWELMEKPKFNEEIIYPVDDQGREKRWKWGLDRVKENPEDLFVREVKGKNHIFHKNRMTHPTVLPNTWWDKNEYSAQDHGTRILKAIFGDLKTFPYPKAVLAVEDCLRVLSSKKNAIFLDFFAGSGTTGHAVINLNQDDNGSRQFILCTNNENNIARDDCYERIKRIINGYKDHQTNKEVKGIPSNLKFYTVDFVPAGDTDQHKTVLKEKITEMICIKEEAFMKVKSTKKYKIFKGNSKHVAIIYDLLSIETVKKEITKIKTGFSVYIFSLGDDSFEDEFEGMGKRIEVIPIPGPILETYKNILKDI